jgi:regulator of protease activity HflC (stomatin/prohibitin superfamily)
MWPIRILKVRRNERAFQFRDRELVALLGPGRHFVWNPLLDVLVDRVSVRDVWLEHPELDVIAKSGVLGDQARVLDLKDHDRAIVRVDGRLEAVLGPGLHALWTVFHEVRVEVFDARSLRFAHDDLTAITAVRGAASLLEIVPIETGQVGLLFKDGRIDTHLGPGVHALWKGVARTRVERVDLREQVLDVAGQEIMTADKVTLRLNAVVAFKVVDALQALTAVDDHVQALYREAQLALRAIVGTRELDALLSDKDDVAREVQAAVRDRIAPMGLELASFGIRDVILPGDMRDLLNKVTEARKAAEADLITRREETAAMRSQANTARILDSNPTLMRLRELEVLEKVAEKARLSVVLGEQGLTDRVVKLL